MSSDDGTLVDFNARMAIPKFGTNNSLRTTTSRVHHLHRHDLMKIDWREVAAANFIRSRTDYISVTCDDQSTLHP